MSEKTPAQKLADTKRRWKKLFGPAVPFFIDESMVMIFRKVSIDVIAFDEWLMSKFPEEYKDGMSMNEFLVLKYGQESSDFVSDLLKP